MQQKACLIPTYSLLTDRQIELINSNSHVLHHTYGEVIFLQERPVSHLIFLKSGLVKLYRQIEEKREIILDIVSPNRFIGLASVFYEKLYPYSVSSLEEGELVYVSSTIFRDILTENGEYAVQIMTELSTMVVFLMKRMIALTKKQVPGRLAEMLLFFSNDIYKNNEIHLPLNRQEIADLVQTSKETVSRTLTEFKNDRIIELDDRKVTLKSIELLEVLNRIG